MAKASSILTQRKHDEKSAFLMNALVGRPMRRSRLISTASSAHTRHHNLPATTSDHYTRSMSRYGLVALVLALLGGFLWAAHDIETSHSSTAAVGWLAVPILLFLIGCAVVILDAAGSLAWRFTHRRTAQPPDPNDFSGLPPPD
jgi:hypothetical protein